MKAAYFVSPALAALLAYALTPVVLRLAMAVGAIDRPDFRKVHRSPTPRLGGLAVLAGVACVSVLSVARVRYFEIALPIPLLRAMAVGLLPVIVVSVWDDIRPLKALPKALAHTLGAGVAVGLGVTLNDTIHLFERQISIGSLAPLISVAWIVGVTNAFNIVDGLDGLAGGLALISATSLASVFFVSGNIGVACLSLVIAGGLAGFLPWNLHPARIFLGDTGSASIGYIMACLALSGGATLSAGLAILIPAFVLGLPIAETVVSMSRRMIRRAGNREATGVFSADRSHFHHRLLDLGVSQQKAVLLLWAVGGVLGGVGLLSTLVTATQAGLLLLATLAGGFVAVSRLGYDEFAVIRKGLVLRLYDAPLLRITMFTVFVELVLVGVSVWIAIALRTDDWGMERHKQEAVRMVAVLAPATIAAFQAMGVYRRAWRLAGMEDFVRLASAVGLATLGGVALDGLLIGSGGTISAYGIYGMVKLLLAASARGSYRVLSGMRDRARHEGPPVAIYGAGKAGIAALREARENSELGLVPVAFLDDAADRAGTCVNGVEVVGPIEALSDLALRYEGLTVIVSSKKIGPERLRDAARICRSRGVRLLRMELSFRELLPPPGEATESGGELA